MRYQLTPVRTTITKEKNAGKDGEKEEPFLVGIEINTAFRETSLESAQETRNRIITWSSNHTTVYIPKENK